MRTVRAAERAAVRRATARHADAQQMLAWLASPLLPVGGYSYSEGLEAAVEAGVAIDEAGTLAWLRSVLELNLRRSEIVVVARALAAWRGWPRDPAAAQARLRALQAWVRATRETHEWGAQGAQMGRSMLAWIAERRPGDERVAWLRALPSAPPGPVAWPVAWALAAAPVAADAHAVLTAFAFGWAENLVQSAMRAVPLGQNAGQRLMQDLLPALRAAVDDALALPPPAPLSHAPMLAILSSRHEVQYSRLFRS